MATIQSSIRINDGMTPALQSMTKALNITLSSFEAMERASGTAVNTNSIKAAREELNKAEIAFNDIGDEIRHASSAQRVFNDDIRRGQHQTDGLTRKIKRMAGALIGVTAIRRSLQSVNDWLGASDLQARAETQLSTVMERRMGTVNIEAVLDLTNAQQQIGVVGDEIQLMGAQQIATFLDTEEALLRLIPAMNNLAVQQNGINLTSENMVNIANLMGKVMQGQLGALTRVGITFNEAQEHALRYGTEVERAAILSEVIADNVGIMNEVIAKTPAGQIQQIKNEWGDIKEILGDRVYPAVLDFFGALRSNIPTAQSLMQGFAGVVSGIITVFARVLDVSAAVYNFTVRHWPVIEPIVVSLTAALIAYNATVKAQALAITIAKIAQNGLNMAMLKNPILWIAMLIGVLITAIYKWVQSVGGLEIAWKLAMHTLLTLWDLVLIRIMMGVDKIQTFMDNMKVGVLNILQGLTNEAISVINKFIEKVNKIPGVSIDLIEKVTFGTEAAIANEAAQRARESAIAEMQMSAQSAFDERLAEIKSLQERNVNSDLFDNMEAMNYLANTAENTASMAESMSVSEEELKYLREIAEQEAINRFTTAEIKVELGGVVNQVSKDIDLDGMVAYLEDELYEAMISASEGVHV